MPRFSVLLTSAGEGQKTVHVFLSNNLRYTKQKNTTDPLGLGVGEFYSRLVTGMLRTGTAGNHPPGLPVPTFSALQPWLDKIKDPALACMTAQRVAAGMARYVYMCTRSGDFQRSVGDSGGTVEKRVAVLYSTGYSSRQSHTV